MFASIKSLNTALETLLSSKKASRLNGVSSDLHFGQLDRKIEEFKAQGFPANLAAAKATQFFLNLQIQAVTVQGGTVISAGIECYDGETLSVTVQYFPNNRKKDHTQLPYDFSITF
jgi:hypothetical protein